MTVSSRLLFRRSSSITADLLFLRGRWRVRPRIFLRCYATAAYRAQVRQDKISDACRLETTVFGRWF
jgi:hypothetical protein